MTGIQLRLCGTKPANPWQREVVQPFRQRRGLKVEHFDDRRQGVAHLRGTIADVGPEQGTRDDGQRDAVHLGGDVIALALAPQVRALCRETRHAVGIRRDAVPMEGRLSQTSLPEMMRALAREEPFTEHALGALQSAALREEPVALHEHFFNGLGMSEERDQARVRHASPPRRRICWSGRSGIRAGRAAAPANGARRRNRSRGPGRRRAAMEGTTAHAAKGASHF